MTLLVATPAPSQVIGVVADSSGRPIAGAMVQLWSATERLAAINTDSRGRFAFDSVTAVRATLLVFRAIGYRPTEAVTSGRRASLSVVMQTISVTLSPIEVRSGSRACLDHEDHDARQLWNVLRKRYERSGDSGVLATRMRLYQGVVAESLLGVLDSAALVRGQRGATEGARALWRRQIGKEGYARRVGQPADQKGRWEYVPLESDYVRHFVEPLFGARHRFAWSPRPDGGASLSFCPTSTRHPEIAGELELSDDTALIAVNWIFVIPEGGSPAGGRVSFAKPFEWPSALLPIDGVRWRRTVDGRYEVLWQVYDGWTLGRAP